MSTQKRTDKAKQEITLESKGDISKIMSPGMERKQSLKDALIDIDIRLGLKERLSTAYEYHQVDRKSFFINRLIEEANNLLESLRGKQIVPRHFSAVHLMIPIFSVMIILLLAIDFSPEASEQERAAAERFKQIGVEMEKYANRVRPKKAEEEKESLNLQKF